MKLRRHRKHRINAEEYQDQIWARMTLMNMKRAKKYKVDYVV